MDAWIVGLRGNEDIQLELRALLGAPVASLGAVEVHAFETSDPATAAQLVESVATATGTGTVALALAPPAGDRAEAANAQECAVALCLAGSSGEILVARDAAQRLDSFLLFARPRRRKGWRLPVPCLAVADAPRLRTACRAAALALPETPRFVGRDDELQALLDAVEAAGESPPRAPVVLRAAPSMGATRLVLEGASLAGATLLRRVVPAVALEREATGPLLASLDLERTLERLRGAERSRPPWLLVETDAARHARSLGALVAAVSAQNPSLTVIVRVAPDAEVPWEAPEAEVELGPLAPAESRALVRAMLGERAEDALVDALARRGGATPRHLVAAVRVAVTEGSICREDDAKGPLWRPRARRPVRLGGRARRDHAGDHARLVAALEPRSRRALVLARSLGDDAEEYAVRGLLRTILGQPEAFDALRAAGLVGVIQGRVDLGAALCEAVPADEALVRRVETLREAGTLSLLALAEQAVALRHREAPAILARATRGALAAGDRAVAVRLAALLRAFPAHGQEQAVLQTLKAVVKALGPAVQLSARASSGITPAVRHLTPETLERMATLRESRGEDGSADRLRALSALLRGDAVPAMRVAAAPRSARDHLLRALAHARGARMMAAVRDTIAALARARRGGDRAGESASLALLASLYAALGRADEAAQFAERARAR